MKSIVIRQPNELKVEERDRPEPAPGEVRVKVKLAGICGSDSHIYRGHNPLLNTLALLAMNSTASSMPLAMGCWTGRSASG